MTDTQSLGEILNDFRLPYLDGRPFRLSRVLAEYRGAVVIFWSGMCSHCVRYDGFLHRFAGAYPSLVLAVVACRQGESPEHLRTVVRTRDLHFPILLDERRLLAAAYRVHQTPRAFLLDDARRLLYRGAVDNFKYPGDENFEPYLTDAVEDFLGGSPVRRPETPGFGCPVESVYYPSSPDSPVDRGR